MDMGGEPLGRGEGYCAFATWTSTAPPPTRRAARPSQRFRMFHPIQGERPAHRVSSLASTANGRRGHALEFSVVIGLSETEIAEKPRKAASSACSARPAESVHPSAVGEPARHGGEKMWGFLAKWMGRSGASKGREIGVASNDNGTGDSCERLLCRCDLGGPEGLYPVTRPCVSTIRSTERLPEKNRRM